MDLINLKQEISDKNVKCPRPGAPLIAVSAISAITAGAGLAFAVDSIFGGCGGSREY